MLNVHIKKKLTSIEVNVSFHLANEIVVLFGPSGSGKTTILNCIAGIVQPDDGNITLNGKSFFSINQKPLPIQARNVGYLFQDYALFPHMTVEENICYGLKDSNKQPFLERISKELGIGHLLSSYPKQISGGEKQRVALARALASEPDALLLDEPFSALDEKTKAYAHKELLRLHRLWKIPIILVTHNRFEAEKLASTIFEIKDGKFTKNNETDI